MDYEQVIEADLVYYDGRFAPGKAAIDADGVITAVGELAQPTTLRLEGRALLPGMVSAHSHAFQRGLRGAAQTFVEREGSFWSWRDEMYQFVESLTPESFYEHCKLAFSEMLRAGVTSIGEFHYVHHDATGAGYAFDDAVLSAAVDAGVRLCLLETYYAMGGIGTPLIGVQQRFGAATLDDFLRQADELAARCKAGLQTVGLAGHSIRAVLLKELVDLRAEARERGMVFHMHVEEQLREIEECREAYGAAPLKLINDKLDVGPDVTAVHCTHSTPEELQRFIESGGAICVCPLTEGDLGDGVADVAGMWTRGACVTLGGDANARIDFFEEQRWLEYVQRLTQRKRGVCLGANGDAANGLFGVATTNGARSLGLNVGAIAPGKLADLFTVDLGAQSLIGWTPETLLASVVFGGGCDVVREVWVGGRRVV